MVESAALEMRYTGNGIGGSNPPVSAIDFFALVDTMSSFFDRGKNDFYSKG